jgi:D-alanyl-D-alanine dipeptidase
MLDYLKMQYLRYVTLSAYRSGDWRTIPIQDNGQKLVQIPEDMAFPFYARVMKLVTDERMFLREEVLEKVFSARERINKLGLDLMVYDGWRSVELQENLFWFYMRAFTAARFNKKEEFEKLKDFSEIKAHFESLSPETQSVLREANRTYVSWPSKDPKAPSPHATGGAVDVWLIQNGTEANLGVPFDWMEEEAGAFYHLKLRRKRLAGNDRKVCKNRTNMILAMAGAGFSCYGPEFWHFNYGNQMDALVKGGTAKYSYIEP